MQSAPYLELCEYISSKEDFAAPGFRFCCIRYQCFYYLYTDTGRRVGVPGELKLYKRAHDTYGRLPWKSLFKPTLDLMANGMVLRDATHAALVRMDGILNTKRLSFANFTALWWGCIIVWTIFESSREKTNIVNSAYSIDSDQPRHAAQAYMDRHFSPPVDYLFHESLLYTSIALCIGPDQSVRTEQADLCRYITQWPY